MAITAHRTVYGPLTSRNCRQNSIWPTWRLIGGAPCSGSRGSGSAEWRETTGETRAETARRMVGRGRFRPLLPPSLPSTYPSVRPSVRSFVRPSAGPVVVAAKSAAKDRNLSREQISINARAPTSCVRAAGTLPEIDCQLPDAIAAPSTVRALSFSPARDDDASTSSGQFLRWRETSTRRLPVIPPPVGELMRGGPVGGRSGWSVGNVIYRFQKRARLKWKRVWAFYMKISCSDCVSSTLMVFWAVLVDRSFNISYNYWNNILTFRNWFRKRAPTGRLMYFNGGYPNDTGLLIRDNMIAMNCSRIFQFLSAVAL